MWALDEEATPDMKPALKRFMSWTQKQKPRTKNRTPRHSECDGAQLKQRETGKTVPIICDAFRQKTQIRVTKNRTYIHIAMGRASGRSNT